MEITIPVLPILAFLMFALGWGVNILEESQTPFGYITFIIAVVILFVYFM